jgi:teichoic acid transport system ATP-binding protein
MLINQKEIENRIDYSKEVIKATDLGVSFSSNHREDYLSLIIKMFKSQKEPKKSKEKIFWPLRELNFSGYKGEILGIIGSNGSGKTTLCKLITGILQPDEGELQVDGKVSALFSLGMGFNKELTGRENVYLNGMMLGIEKEKINEFIEEIHEFSGIGKFLDQPMKYYSSGMRARLGFSVAAYLDPEILILDEALNTGDAEFSRKAALKMKELVKKAKMVILVTHSLRYAERNCDRLIWLDKGVIRANGNPSEVINLYKQSLPEIKPRNRKRLELTKTKTEIKNNIVVKAEDMGVYYKLGKERFWALKNINFQVREGEVIGIIGHNGAGKSTLCKVLTNILQPDKGKIFINGETTSLLGYGTGFNAQLTGTDNIYLNGMLLGIPKEKVEEDYPKIVEFSELKKFIDKPVKYYSSGMRSRLAFSIAATLQPDIFIIDEALSTGDIAFQQKASEQIQSMMEKAKAVIIVSHSMNFVENVCTRAIWMEGGQIRFDGDPKEAVIQYRQAIRQKRQQQRGK